MSFFKSHLEELAISRRNYLFASAAGIATLPMPGSLCAAVDGPSMAWSYRNRSNPYWNAIVSGEEPMEHREVFGPSIIISSKDAANFKSSYIDSVPTYDWTDFWGPTTPAH